MKINSLKKQKYLCIIHTLSEKAFKGTVVNQTLPSLHEGSLAILLTVPLKSSFQELYKGRKQIRNIL